MPEKQKRRQRSNLNGQEEMVDALYDFARDVEDIVANGGSFKKVNGGVHVSKAHLDAVGKAMERIAQGFGYRIVGIQ